MQLAGLLLWPARFRARIKAAGRRTATVAAAFSQIMNGRFAGADADAPAVARSPAGGKYERLIDYYESAGPDFEEWSPAFNMHFGFYRRGANPFRREPMLEEMNRQVLDRLGLARDREHVILDLGCGVGATVRYAAVMFPLARILGLTVVPWQVAKGNAWNLRLELCPRANLELADYTRTGLPDACADGAVAIESACHADGPDKEPFIREAARILRPGARLVVADGFLKDDAHSLDPLSRRLHQALCRSFVLPELGQIPRFTDTLRRHGFQDITPWMRFPGGWRLRRCTLPWRCSGSASKKRFDGSG